MDGQNIRAFGGYRLLPRRQPGNSLCVRPFNPVRPRRRPMAGGSAVAFDEGLFPAADGDSQIWHGKCFNKPGVAMCYLLDGYSLSCGPKKDLRAFFWEVGLIGLSCRERGHPARWRASGPRSQETAANQINPPPI